MAVAKPKKPRRKLEDMESLQSEVATFASSLGLASSVAAAAASGFDDSDFRKTGPMKPPKAAPKLPNSRPPRSPSGSEGKKAPRPPKGRTSKSNPLDHVDPFGGGGGDGEKASAGKVGVNLPKLPLARASSPLGLWYEELAALEEKVFGAAGQRGGAPALGLDELKRLVERKTEVAEKLIAQYAGDYEAKTRDHGEWRFVRMAARSGTTNDKVSALATLVGDNPIANVKSLDILLGMVRARVGKRYAFKGFDHLAELFKTRLLPDRKLKCLLQRPIDSLPESSDGLSLLLFWYWEDRLKERYEWFVIALEKASTDKLPDLKNIAMKLIHGLLRSKMEQERKLLYALVNKLGDPLRKAASTAGYYLSCLLSEHPNMKLVVIEEVDSFIFRPHVGPRAKYHAVNFLSQIFLSKRGDGPKVAKRLVDIYFALFKLLISSRCDDAMNDKNDKKLKNNGKDMEKRIPDKKSSFKILNKKGEDSFESCVEMDSRLLCALLTGVNRAFPFVASDEADDIIEVQSPILFRLVHSSNFNVGIQALTLLYQISYKNQILSDRFYRALYSKLLVPSVLNSSKHEMFLGLLFKAMKSDLNVKRISAFSKRLLQVSLQQPPQYACGCLCLISEVLKARPPLWTMMLQIESIDEDLEHFKDITEDSNEIADVASADSTKLFDSMLTMEHKGGLPDEIFTGVENGKDTQNCSSRGKISNATLSSCGTEGQVPSTRASTSAKYDPRLREPAYCHAETASWWELTLLASHVHPSVAAMAQTLLSGVNIVYTGDPLNDLSLAAFLDKFMEKKPKLNQRAEGIWHGGSQIAPSRKLDMDNHLIGEEILRLAEDEVPPEDIVFHKFYANKNSQSKRKKKKKILAEDTATGELLPDSGDSEDEVESMFGFGKLASEDNADYDYDDLDKVAMEDDEDLLGHGSDEEIDLAGNVSIDEELDSESISDVVWDTPDDSDAAATDDVLDQGQNRSNKKKRKSQESPFVSIEDYERGKKKYVNVRRRKPKTRKKASD
uniref:CCAAT/enhancer-binding protein zeta n=2 Tax=Anthurium amnicola TaxID=1678845 RepID=A0A1D1Y494_9ARAE